MLLIFFNFVGKCPDANAVILKPEALKGKQYEVQEYKKCDGGDKINLLILDQNYCALLNPCNTNDSVCLELPYSVKLNTNIPYLCLCSNSTAGYPYCMKKVNYFKEIGSPGTEIKRVFFIWAKFILFRLWWQRSNDLWGL